MRIVHEWGRYIGIEHDGVERLRYNYQLEGDVSAPRPFCHPIRTPAGIEITALEPLDHTWHRGLWFAWKFVNGVNYWEEQGEIVGRQITLAPPVIEPAAAQNAVRWTSEIAWRDAQGGVETTRLRERRVIACRLADDGALALDWTSEQTAQEDVLLDRTPFTTWGGYGGLFVRLTQALQEQTIVLDDGTTTDRPLGETARWGAIQGRLDTGRDNQAALVFLPSPQNRRAPEPFYGSARPFYNFFGPAPLFHEPLPLARGETLRLAYRVLVLPRPVDATEVDGYYRDSTERETDPGEER